jgi:hypothetical protein
MRSNNGNTTVLTCDSEQSLDSLNGGEIPQLSEKSRSAAKWTTEVLARMLKDVIVQRNVSGEKPNSRERLLELETLQGQKEGMVLDEVVDIITLPKFDAKLADKEDTCKVELSEIVFEQLHSFVMALASLYLDNPFHNFEHATAVTMCVTKLLSRIVAPDLNDDQRTEETLHDHTYGITSDPLTQFTVVLSALIHDLDHPGVPNAQLIKEDAPLASNYRNKSIAEQNSVDIAVNLLESEQFEEFRHTIYSNESEFKRFRQLLANTVMATDIMDKELGVLRKARWNKAFSEGPQDEDKDTTVNRKATIVIEHIIQASDVSHTMQHWYVYRNWNKNLFLEMHKAYKEGRADTNPAENWYQGELGFYDFYIIPLAKKLKDCGVFGVSSDEFLNYATQNRRQWEARGQEIVAELVDMANNEGGNKAAFEESSARIDI